MLWWGGEGDSMACRIMILFSNLSVCLQFETYHEKIIVVKNKDVVVWCRCFIFETQIDSTTHLTNSTFWTNWVVDSILQQQQQQQQQLLYGIILNRIVLYICLGPNTKWKSIDNLRIKNSRSAYIRNRSFHRQVIFSNLYYLFVAQDVINANEPAFVPSWPSQILR